MKSWILALLLVQSSAAYSQMVAFKCDWDTGDVIGAEEVADSEKTLTWKVEDDGTTITVKINNIRAEKSSGTVTLETEEKITIKSTECEMTR